jgi:hypothetical protein
VRHHQEVGETMSKSTQAVIASWARSFLAACLAQFIALGGGAFDFGADGWKSVLSAGIAAVVPVIIRWLNPNDKAFGVKE